MTNLDSITGFDSLSEEQKFNLASTLLQYSQFQKELLDQAGQALDQPDTQAEAFFLGKDGLNTGLRGRIVKIVSEQLENRFSRKITADVLTTPLTSLPTPEVGRRNYEQHRRDWCNAVALLRDVYVKEVGHLLRIAPHSDGVHFTLAMVDFLDGKKKVKDLLLESLSLWGIPNLRQTESTRELELEEIMSLVKYAKEYFIPIDDDLRKKLP